MTYAILVPLKATARGKSRLGLPDAQRIALAASMARDTIAALRAVPAVSSILVLAEDPRDAELLRLDSVEVLLTAAAGLNEAIVDGARELTSRGWSGPVAVLPADLPFLTAADLEAALDAAAGRPGVVADAAGVGTTLLVAADPGRLRPRFGPDSFRLHQEVGARPLSVAVGSTLHLDVDTLADLHLPAEREPLGTHTQAVLAGFGGLNQDRSPQVTVLP